MPTLARNSRASGIVYQESAFGVAPAPGAPGLGLHLIESQIAARQALVQSRVINGTRQSTEPYLDSISVDGNLTVQVDPIGIGFMFTFALGLPTTTGAGPYVHVWKVTTQALGSATIERLFADVGLVYRAIGCRLNTFNFDMVTGGNGNSGGGILEMPFGWMGVDEVRDTVALDTAPYTPPLTCFRYPSITLREAGVTYAKATHFGMNFDNAMQGVPTLGNGGKLYDIVEGIVGVSGTFSTLLASHAIATKAAAGTESSLGCLFPGTDGTSSLDFSLPEIKYELFSPSISGGTGPVAVDVQYRSFFGNDAGGSMMIITLTNGHPSYAAAIPA